MRRFAVEAVMQNYMLVMPEHLNQYGFLFGGHLLKWVDESSWIAATLDYPGRNFVTVGLDRVEFRKKVQLGTILTFHVNKVKEGTTAVHYAVSVSRAVSANQSEDIFSTTVTLVRIDAEGNKLPLSAPV